MEIAELFLIIKWWAVIFAVGILFLPLTISLFSTFIDKGYILSKVIGVIFISYLIFILGIAHLASFTRTNVIIILVLVFLLNVIFFYLKRSKKNFKKQLYFIAKNYLLIFILEELLFFAALFFWSFIRAHQPDIRGLEKFMDYGFVNSILRSEFSPPRDMWFTPLPINYYYFGHLVTAVLTKLTQIPSSITYNLMLATLFALTFTCSFSIGANLYRGIRLIKTKVSADQLTKSVFVCGFLTAFLVAFAGNLHTIYAFFKPYATDNPKPIWELMFSPFAFPNSYWYPNATRFIHNTIHEFPIYSFVVSDLHGHVLDIPVVLLTIAVLLSLVQNSKLTHSVILRSPELAEGRREDPMGSLTSVRGDIRHFKLSTLNFPLLTLLAFLLAVMYMTNVWDGAIYLLLTALLLLLKNTQVINPPQKQKWRKYLNFIFNARFKLNFYPVFFSILTLISFFIIFSLPFSIYFKPFVSGIGVLCAPKFLTNIGNLGPFLFETDHCQKSPFWQLVILYGFFYFWVISYIIFLFKKGKGTAIDIFVITLIFLSTLLILIPELVYIKDIYPAHYRANTMFKLVYQSFMMLSICVGYITVRILSDIKKGILTFFYLIIASGLFYLVSIYPSFAINSYYDNLKNYRGLNGIEYLKKIYPSDYQAILWLNKNIKNQPVILEAQGDSYTDYARVSANTGLPTVLGWAVHEWLWRGTYDVPAPRIKDVKTLYETKNLDTAKKLIKKYNISLVFIGDLESQKYPLLNEAKFKKLGKVVFQKDQTKIYQIDKF